MSRSSFATPHAFVSASRLWLKVNFAFERADGLSGIRIVVVPGCCWMEMDKRGGQANVDREVMK